MCFNRSSTSESFRGNLDPPTERPESLNRITTTPKSRRFSSRFSSNDVSDLTSRNPNPETLSFKRSSNDTVIIEPPVANVPLVHSTDKPKLSNESSVETKTNTSRFISLTTGFSFKKDDNDDDNSRYTLNVYKSSPVLITNDDNDKSSKRLSYKIDDLPLLGTNDNNVRRSDKMKELLNSNQQIADTIESILEKEIEEISVSSESPLASTHRPSPIPFVIQNLPEPGQKPIVIQLKAQTGPRTHGPRIGSGEVVPLYSRPVNRVVESLNQNLENQPPVENTESNDNEKDKTVPKVYLKTVIKRPLTSNIKSFADNKESDSIFSFLRQPFRSRSTNSDTSYNKNGLSHVQNDNVESVANILPRQKIFRDVFNPKAENTSPSPPAVSPYKTLENLRRDIIEKMLPKFNTTNQFVFVLSTTQSPRNNFVARGNIRSYEHFESTTESEPVPSTTHRPKLFTNLYRFPTTTTEIPTTETTSTEPSTTTEATTVPVLIEETTTTTTTLKPTTTSVKYDYLNRNRNVYISSEAKAFSATNKDRPIASAYTSRGSIRRNDDDVDAILESPEPDRPTYSRLSAPITFEALKSKTRNPYRIIDDISNRVDSRPPAPRLLGGFLSNNDDNAIETVSELTTDPYDYNDFEDKLSTTSSTTTERTTTTTSTTTTPPPPPSVEPPVAVRSRPTATTRRSYTSNKCTDNNSLQQKCDNNLSQRYKQPLPPFTHPKKTFTYV